MEQQVKLSERLCVCTHTISNHPYKEAKRTPWRASCTSEGCSCKRYKWDRKGANKTVVVRRTKSAIAAEAAKVAVQQPQVLKDLLENTSNPPVSE
jgi:hypothetical protein